MKRLILIVPLLFFGCKKEDLREDMDAYLGLGNTTAKAIGRETATAIRGAL